MPNAAKDYRDELYRLREHPRLSHSDLRFSDERDSLAPLYLSLIPFMAAEYFVEISAQSLVSGLVFPTGYLLFWAFFYTYYRPGFLEGRLGRGQEFSLVQLPAMLIGVAIWFVKVTVIEFFHLALFQWFGSKAQQTPRPVKRRVVLVNVTHYSVPKSGFRVPPPPPKRPTFPPDVLAAMKILEAESVKDWATIHHQYRVLAKRFHPDLNQDITAGGARFRQIDAAYRKLLSVRSIYFKD